MKELISKNAALNAIRNAYVDTEEGTNKKAVAINVGLTKAVNTIQDISPDEGDDVRVAVYDAVKKIISDGDIAWELYQKIMQEIEQ